MTARTRSTGGAPLIGRFARAACAALLLLALPATAHAHTRLKRSDPGPKAILSSAPQNIELWFTEEIELTLSRVVLTDGRGISVPLGDVISGDEQHVSYKVPIYTELTAGNYTVNWSTVSIDGHPAKGRFVFRVLGPNEMVDSTFAAEALPTKGDSASRDAPLAGRGASSLDDSTLVTVSPLLVITRLISLSTMLLVIGAVAFRYLVIGRAEGMDGPTRARLARRLSTPAALAATVFAFVAFGRLMLEERMVASNPVFDVSHLRALAMTTSWGAAWLYTVGSAIVAIAALIFARTLPGASWPIAALASVGIAIGSALSGHSAAIRGYAAMAVGFDAAHVLAVSAWIGALFWMAAIGLPFLKGQPDYRTRTIHQMVTTYSPVALASAAIVVITGGISGKFRIPSIAAIYQSAYGQTLLLKLLVFALVGLLGFINWRRGKVTKNVAQSMTAVEETARVELVVGLFVIAVTAVLVGMPLPVQ